MQRNGFALVEVMVSATILVVGALGLLSTIVTSRALEQRTQTWSGHVRAVNDVVERLRNGPLTTRVQEFLAQPTLVAHGETVTVAFPVATLAQDLPSYRAPASPFVDVDHDGRLDVVAANSANPGLLPVSMTLGTGKNPTVLELLVASR